MSRIKFTETEWPRRKERENARQSTDQNRRYKAIRIYAITERTRPWLDIATTVSRPPINSTERKTPHRHLFFWHAAVHRTTPTLKVYPTIHLLILRNSSICTMKSTDAIYHALTSAAHFYVLDIYESIDLISPFSIHISE
jgi:hypothetical protein